MPLLAVGEQKRSGLILCKQHYAEFAGPGAAIHNPSSFDYTQIITIGSPEIVEVIGYEARQQAYGRRIQWVRWLQRIVAQPDANQRAEKLFAGFEAFFGSEVLAGLPNDVLALLAGVLPHTITLLRSQHQDIERGDGGSGIAIAQPPEIRIIRPAHSLGIAGADCRSIHLITHLAKTSNFFPCSA